MSAEGQGEEVGEVDAKEAGAIVEGADEQREELLKGVAVGEDEPGDARGMVGDDKLADGAAGVVANEGDIVEVEGGQKVGDELGDAQWAKIGVGMQWKRVSAQGKVWRDATKLRDEVRNKLAPEGMIRQQAVKEDEGWSGSLVGAADGSVRKFNLLKGRMWGSGGHTGLLFGRENKNSNSYSYFRGKRWVCQGRC